MSKTQQEKLIDVLTELGIKIVVEVNEPFTEVSMNASISGRHVAFIFKDGKYEFTQ